jgi:POT family proton-dependent oligopeptide transporter
MWERFSYYGMRALLVLYMTKYLLLNGRAENVAGLATLKRTLEAVFGSLDIQPFSSQIYGLYTALVYLTPIFGGLVADRVLGRRRTIMIGAAIMAAGHFMMAFESLFLLALLLLIIGNGAFKPNISVQVGDLYAPGDPRRDRAFDLLRRHQSRCVSGAAHLRYARRGRRLALWFCRGGRRHDDRAHHLYCRGAAPAARRSATC